MVMLLFVHEGLSVSDNIWMSHSLEESDFIEGLFLLFTVHFGDIDNLVRRGWFECGERKGYLHDVVFAIVDILDKDSTTKATFADNFDFTIIFHVTVAHVFKEGK
jgi:hypothetical protein